MLLINKPPGPTSHDIVDMVRKKTGVSRVGHTGTLDPFAQGLLIVLVGREETKRQQEFLKLNKEYVATMRLGKESDTGDKMGAIQLTLQADATVLHEKTVREALKKFTGTQQQIPPAYSAIKVGGKKAYELARRGEDVRLSPREITVYELELVEYAWPMLTIRARVSSGTYIRALAQDIGRALGTGAYLEKLVRTQIGTYMLRDAKNIDDLQKGR